eukprot:1959196-Pyramimonas_sp.AAC.1
MALQEVHSTEAELRQALHRLHIPHRAFCSFLPQADAGGVALVIPCDAGVERRARFVHEALARGRVQRVGISGIPA